MIDMTKTIEPKSDQLNSDDLIGGTRTIRITGVSKCSEPEQPIAIAFEGDNKKPYKPCKSMRRVLVHIWGKDGQSYVGKSLTLYRDPKVKFGGLEVGGIRISHASDIKEKITLALTATKQKRSPFIVLPLDTKAQAPAQKEAAPISDELSEAGENAASKGVEEYKAWLASLEADDKESIRPMHKAWSAKAKAADEKKSAPEEIPLEDDDGPAI